MTVCGEFGLSRSCATGEDAAPPMTVPFSDPIHSLTGMDRWQQERRDLEAELDERITLDALTGPVGLTRSETWHDDARGPAGWLIAQRKGGHRHSIDDVLTAWYALQVSPPVTEHLDLGTGIGTVGLLTLWGMGENARLTCVEAQEISYRLLQSNITFNGLRQRVDCSHGDLRELALMRKFPLITGSPPYFPEGSGVIPQDSQKAHARFELRGDVSDYAKAAVKHLAPGGWFVLCFPSRQKQRAVDGILASGLKIVSQRDVIPRETLEPLFTLFACRHAEDVEGAPIINTPLTVRLSGGRLTEEMAEVRRSFGFADGESHGGYGT
ncbi:MAG TPA: methyltransferase [Luteolibacter sp.]